MPALKKRLEKEGAMRVIASAIVKNRYLIFAVFLAAAVYCALSIGKTKINDDITAFLPADTETCRGIHVMADEFVTYGSANIMVSNITFETAERIAADMAATPHVTSVGFDNTPAHFTGASALFSLSFDGFYNDKDVVAAFRSITDSLDGFDTYISSDIGYDIVAELTEQVTGVLLIAAAVIIAVLLLTSRSFFEVVIYGIVFIFAALLNMGTNFWLGEISSITNSIAVILQLSLAIDYAIIFAHRYQDEAEKAGTREAVTSALSQAIVEIASSSLTTISGLVALTLMQFGLGRDLGIVLSKGIICSMLTVFLLMPGLIMLFPGAIRRTKHRDLIPNISGWGRFLMKSKVLFVIIFVILIPLSFYCSQKTVYAFSDGGVDEIIPAPDRTAMHKIENTFDRDTYVALIVPTGDFEAEKKILAEAEALDGIKTATGLANIEIEPGRMLTDEYSPRMFSELLDIDMETAELLFQAYGLEHEQYQAIFGTTSDYTVPAIDMFFYLFEKIDQGIVTLDAGQMETLEDLRGELTRGADQLRGTEHDRMVFSATVPVEGEESIALVEELRTVATRYYDTDDVLVVGDITSSRDLADSYNSDSLLIAILTALFVFVILLFTFRTLGGALILVFVIQVSVWINFSFPYVTHFSTFFVTNMIVSAIQMGATIDYAIVINNRYSVLKEHYPKREAMIHAVNESFPTVITSGSILTVAGLLIAYRVSYVYVGHIGQAVGRGALISVILVLSVLPQLLVLLDGFVEKTRFRLKKPEDTDTAEAEDEPWGTDETEKPDDPWDPDEPESPLSDEAEGGAEE